MNSTISKATIATMMSKKLIVIVGATGSGKTDLSLHLARHYEVPIISTDSRQVYKGMSIGTAQPTAEQLQLVEHHFIATLDINHDFNCGEYEVEALKLLDKLFAQYDFVVAVGGSGLYIKALCEGLDDLPEMDEKLRATLSERLKNEGVAALAEHLKELDFEYYNVVDRNNPARVLRALEVCLQTGRPYSQQRTGVCRNRNFEMVKIGVDIRREELYDRINRRVDIMMTDGLEAEARALYPHRNLNALQTVGYKELFDYFDGRCSLAEAVELIKRNSRRYAKRQMTWFRRDDDVKWFAIDDFDNIIKHIDFCKS